ncbi:MAG: glutathione synthase [Coxiella sp. RIFCSPHIGHO2_12_FULL_42_15]|nr:MAG: glutathione synthase [Coxiella sp. RIFCSPHIGHO2_12_FULL_42_15]
MNVKMGIVMDPIEHIKTVKDTTFAMMLEAQRRNWQIFYMQPQDIWLHAGLTWAEMSELSVDDVTSSPFGILNTLTQPLVELDVLLIRKDPPFNMEYIYMTYLLEQAQAKGLLVVNNPSSIRDANEKLFASWFPQCCPNTLVTAKKSHLLEFANHEKEIVIKPLGGMGGHSIFHLVATDLNLNVTIEMLTQQETQMVMAQRFIPEIKYGDKRILLIDGEPIGYALARIPHKGDFRGNLAAGASTEGKELTDRDLWICEQVGPELKKRGLLFVGLDVIGDFLTEINVTSPTCARELDKIFNLNIAGDFLDVIEQKLI